ncbi:MAG: riboflavin synthase [bacterium]
MFTGLVEESGRVVELTPTPQGWRFTVECKTVHENARMGDSIANNGCCLTVVAVEGNRLGFDLLEETRRKTNLRSLAPGSLVNLERSLAAHARLGGHFVSGHIDDVGRILRWEREGADYVLEVEAPSGFERYLVPKGSVALDGISLTVGRVNGSRFNVWIIPHTYEITALCERRAGELVNLEFDLLAKYVEKIIAARSN